MGRRTLISFASHEEAHRFDLEEAKKTTPSERMEILAHLIELQKNYLYILLEPITMMRPLKIKRLSI